MTLTAALLAATVLSAPGLEPVYMGTPSPGETLSRLDNSRREMRRFCAEEAARRYRVRERWVDTRRARAAGDGFVVEGSVDLGREGQARFACRFGPRGGFASMRETGRIGVGGGDGADGGVLSEREMRRFCAREAARRYRVNLSAVDIYRFAPRGSGYMVAGRILLRQGRNPGFVCEFGPRGGFKSMAEVRG